jgi:hypothetical protein
MLKAILRVVGDAVVVAIVLFGAAGTIAWTRRSMCFNGNFCPAHQCFLRCSASPFVLLGQSLWLGSYTAALYAILPLMLLMLRIGLEERFLRRELAGYTEYTGRVRYRLLPGIW